MCSDLQDCSQRAGTVDVKPGNARGPLYLVWASPWFLCQTTVPTSLIWNLGVQEDLFRTETRGTPRFIWKLKLRSLTCVSWQPQQSFRGSWAFQLWNCGGGRTDTNQRGQVRVHTGSRSRKPGRRKVAWYGWGRVSPLSAGRPSRPARLKGLWSMRKPSLCSVAWNRGTLQWGSRVALSWCFLKN